MTRVKISAAPLSFLCSLLILGIAGCGGASDTPPLGTVSGTVTWNGEPLQDAYLTFQPETGRASIGRTDSNGQYSLAYTGDKNGALVGKHTVMITTATEGYSDESGEGNDRPAREEILPAKYHSASELTAEVTSGSNTIDFDLPTE
ncbi:MAG: hypothetical protein ACE37I_01985 [Rubinisphaera brasiliensis]|uniref:Carboxypeptidase regulatory-like domain-containing protein n=1 Tax=Rubinisphaera brasiliensis (strain ATCC 49424 / DSM 5305 / JCM 21570 / IAM 15109 / NBRC 103401 / IFAM 1448) TaxID=756272 RepID=F0SQW8_RUBBR|nr:hypothetical protein [Rubinisphaera brasiliensis]ADY60189.1 hypothetical protein Plabr_2589 [Rubinisphaera brasiliensis DSM 5305]